MNSYFLPAPKQRLIKMFCSSFVPILILAHLSEFLSCPIVSMIFLRAEGASSARQARGTGRICSLVSMSTSQFFGLLIFFLIVKYQAFITL